MVSSPQAPPRFGRVIGWWWTSESTASGAGINYCLTGFAIGKTVAEVEDLFGFGRKNSPWHGVNYMDLVPAHRLAWQDDPDSDAVQVLVPRYTDPILGRLVQPRLASNKRYIRVPLEDRGSFLWRLLDGNRRVIDLVRAFEVAYPEDREQSPERVSMYLHAMYDNKFIEYLNIPA